MATNKKENNTSVKTKSDETKSSSKKKTKAEEVASKTKNKVKEATDKIKDLAKEEELIEIPPKQDSDLDLEELVNAPVVEPASEQQPVAKQPTAPTVELPEEMSMDDMLAVLQKSKTPLEADITLAKYLDERSAQRTKVALYAVEKAADDVCERVGKERTELDRHLEEIDNKAESRHNQLLEAVGGRIATAAYVVGLLLAAVLVIVCKLCLPADLMLKNLVSVLVGVIAFALTIGLWPVSSDKDRR